MSVSYRPSVATIPRDPSSGFEFRVASQRVSPAGFSETRNANLFSLGAAAKRTGLTATSTLDIQDTPLSGALQGVGFRGSEAVRIQNGDCYGYSDSTDRWFRTGSWMPLVTAENSLLTTATSFFSGDFAELDQYRVFSWVELDASNTFNVFFAVSTTDGTQVVAPFTLASSAVNQLVQPRSVSCGNWVAITFWSDADLLSVYRWQPDKPTQLSAPITLSAERNYDLLGVPSRSQLWVARPIPATDSQLTEIRPDLSVDRDRVLPGVAQATLAIDRIDSTQEIVLGSLASGTGLSAAQWYDDSLGLINTYAIGVASARITVAITSPTEAYLFTERLTGTTFGIEPSVLDRNGVAITPVTVNRGFGVGLAGKAIAIDGEAYVLVIFLNDQTVTPTLDGDPNQTVYFAYRGRDLAVVSRGWNSQRAAQWGGEPVGAPETNLVGAVVRETGWTWPTLVRNKFGNPTSSSPLASLATGRISQGEFVHDVVNARAKLLRAGGIATWAVGGYLRGYDGRRTFSVDYHTQPVIVSTTTNPGGGSIAVGTYLYAINYSWRDQQGRRYRSTTATTTVVVGAGNASVDLEVQTIRVAERTDIRIEAWRTRAGESSPAFLTSDIGDPTLNDLVAQTVTFTDVQSDAQIEDNEELDQSPIGARIPFEPVPATGFAALAGDRVWFRNPQRPQQAFGSQRFIGNEGITLSSLIYVNLDTEEEFVALADQDGTFFGLSRTKVSVWGGRGPDNNLNGRAFSEPVAFPSAEGCNLLGGIERGANGLIYSTRTGPVPLNRDQSAGGPADPVAELYEFTNQRVVDIVHFQQGHELWVLDDGDRSVEPERGTLTWSTQTRRWTQQTLLQAVGAAASNDGQFAIADTSGRVLLRKEGEFSTGGIATPLILTPGWQRPQGNMLAPYSLQAIGLVLIYFSPHVLAVDVLADDDLSNVIASVTIEPNRDEIRVGTQWGDVEPFATWGATSAAKFGYIGRPGRRYTAKIQFRGTHVSSVTCRMRDQDGCGQAWGYVQIVTSWTPRQAMDKTDILNDKTRTYTIDTI